MIKKNIGLNIIILLIKVIIVIQEEINPQLEKIMVELN